MHQNHYFLRHLIKTLNPIIVGNHVHAIFSQNKDELILQIKNHTSLNLDPIFIIKAHFSPKFCCISFPETHNRKKQNTANLFKPLLGQKVEKINVFQNERAFYIDFQGNITLVFKLFGNRSNVLMYKNRKCIDLFQSNMTMDRERTLESFHRLLPFDFNSFVKCPMIKEYIPTLSGLPNQYLEKQGFNEKTVEEKWAMLGSTIHQFENTKKYYVCKTDRNWHLTLMQIAEDPLVFDNPMEALNELFQRQISEISFVESKNKLISEKNKKINKTANYISNSTRQLEKIRTITDFKKLGDIVMANLSQIEPHSKSVNLLNFYTDEEINIKINPDLSPQKNAEKYYRKSKNQSKEIDNLNKNILLKNKELEKLLQELNELEAISVLKELRTLSKKTKSGSPKTIRAQPYYQRKINEYVILIGKGARQNDEMLQTSTWKEDLWLHVKDASGSHVIIKHKAGNSFPRKIIEAAAQIAAYYSKQKNDTLCPVIYTPRKFVRKRKGDPPGAVVVEKEKVILVEPANIQFI